jgi:hypothetical protein
MEEGLFYFLERPKNLRLYAVMGERKVEIWKVPLKPLKTLKTLRRLKFHVKKRRA